MGITITQSERRYYRRNTRTANTTSTDFSTTSTWTTSTTCTSGPSSISRQATDMSRRREWGRGFGALPLTKYFGWSGRSKLVSLTYQLMSHPM